MRTDALLDERDDGNVIFMLCDEIDRLRAGKPKPQGKTVRAAFKAFVDPFGNVEIPRFNMNAIGKDSQATPSFEGFTVNITADLPIPEEQTVEAEVENANND